MDSHGERRKNKGDDEFLAPEAKAWLQAIGQRSHGVWRAQGNRGEQGPSREASTEGRTVVWEQCGK